MWVSRHRRYERGSSQLPLVAKCRFGNDPDGLNIREETH